MGFRNCELYCRRSRGGKHCKAFCKGRYRLVVIAVKHIFSAEVVHVSVIVLTFFDGKFQKGQIVAARLCFVGKVVKLNAVGKFAFAAVFLTQVKTSCTGESIRNRRKCVCFCPKTPRLRCRRGCATKCSDIVLRRLQMRLPA